MTGSRCGRTLAADLYRGAAVTRPTNPIETLDGPPNLDSSDFDANQFRLKQAA
jgi:hypothetical protein